MTILNSVIPAVGRRIQVIWLVALALGMAGCFSSFDQEKWTQALYQQPQGTGMSRTYSADVEHIIAAISSALIEAHFDQRLDCEPKPFKDYPECLSMNVVRVDDSTSIISATKTERGFASGWFGTQARLTIRSQGPQRTTVTVVSMYRDRRLMGQSDYAPAFFRTMDHELDQSSSKR